MDYEYLYMLIPAPIHLLLAWVLVMPLWGSLIMTAIAAIEMGLGVTLLVLEIKHKKAHDKYMRKLDEELRNSD